MARKADEYLVTVTWDAGKGRKKAVAHSAENRKKAAQVMRRYRGVAGVLAIIIQNVTRKQAHVDQWYAPGAVTL